MRTTVSIFEHGASLLPREMKGRMVSMHSNALPYDVLQLLGPAFLSKAYDFFITSPLEAVFGAFIDDELAGIAVLSRQPDTLLPRIAIRFPFALLLGVAAGFFRYSEVRKVVAGTLLDLFSGAEIKYNPELLYLYVDERYRNNGVGKSLVTAVSQCCMAHRDNALYVKTFNNTDNSAIDFYKKNEFSIVTLKRRMLREFVVFRKSLQ